MTTEPTRADADSIGSLHPLGIAEVPRGWRAFSRVWSFRERPREDGHGIKARGGKRISRAWVRWRKPRGRNDLVPDPDLQSSARAAQTQWRQRLTWAWPSWSATAVVNGAPSSVDSPPCRLRQSPRAAAISSSTDVPRNSGRRRSSSAQGALDVLLNRGCDDRRGGETRDVIAAWSARGSQAHTAFVRPRLGHRLAACLLAVSLVCCC